MVVSKKQRFRWLGTRLPPTDKRRLVVLTGARQTGKTTLAQHVYPDLRYVNLDALEEREALRALRSGGWGRTVGPAVIDEAQKEWAGGLVVHRGEDLEELAPDLWAVPAHRLF